MQDKINLHIILSGDTAKLYRMLSEKKAGISYALRLLAQSEVASSMFENMKDVNAFLNEDMERVDCTSFSKEKHSAKNAVQNIPQSTKEDPEKKIQSIVQHSNQSKQQNNTTVVTDNGADSLKEEDDDEHGFSAGWPQQA